MRYTAKQIENAKYSYSQFLRIETASDYEISVIGINEAEKRTESHNKDVQAILAGDKELERKWKLFFCNEEAKKDQKETASKAKINANKAASSDILSPIKSLRKLGEFGKWLNTSSNEFRKQHFNKKYTIEAVNGFLATL